VVCAKYFTLGDTEILRDVHATCLKFSASTFNLIGWPGSGDLNSCSNSNKTIVVNGASEWVNTYVDTMKVVGVHHGALEEFDLSEMTFKQTFQF